jgi:hypothetical protein
MSEDTLRAVVVEPEILIALDVEHVLNSIEGWRMEVTILARDDQLSHAPACDLLVYSAEQLSGMWIDILRTRDQSGTAIVILTTSDELMSADLPWIRISKPFRNSELVEAVEGALQSRTAT